MARRPVYAAAFAMTLALLLTAGRYGFERDELYFRMLRPSWGYTDQSPWVPLTTSWLAKLSDTTTAIRIPATLFAAGSVIVVAQVVCELGGGRKPQTLAAWGYAFAGLPLSFGHVYLTASPDLLLWPLTTLAILRSQTRSEPRWWLIAGALAGVSTYNKLLVVSLLGSLAVGFVLTGRRRAVTSRWVAGAVVVAMVIAAPNIAYQATHHWPELKMGAALRAHNASDVRQQEIPVLIVMLGPLLVPIWTMGLVELWRAPDWRAARFLVPGFGALMLVVFAMGSQAYYPLGLLSVVYAAGCIPACRWAQSSRTRSGVLWAAVAVNAAVAAVIALPLIREKELAHTPIAALNTAAADQIGWPRYASQIADVARKEGTRVVLASNYGEAGAVSRFASQLSVYSAQNALYDQARPSDAVSLLVVVGAQEPYVRQAFDRCDLRARLDNGVGIDNEEQGQPVAICRGLRMSWRRLWPMLRHLD